MTNTFTTKVEQIWSRNSLNGILIDESDFIITKERRMFIKYIYITYILPC